MIRMNDAGTRVYFGHYEQDGKKKNGSEQIEWIVLGTNSQTGTVLLISKYALDMQPYHEQDSDEPVSWATCSLNKWLNNEFLNTAFTPEEQTLLVMYPVPYGEKQSVPGWQKDEEGTVLETVWLLSYDEAVRYFGPLQKGNQNCLAAPTPYALKIGESKFSNVETEDGDIAGNWWLRSLGYFRGEASGVSDICSPFQSIAYAKQYVRPVICVNMAAAEEMMGNQ